MEVKTLSKTWIKPSSPTPLHLQNFKLSLLDQLKNGVPYATVIFFYCNGDCKLSSSEKFKLFRSSLSEILPKFYPLAGKIKDDLIIDCNDDGVYYLEAQVNYDLGKFLTQPDRLSMINDFLPIDQNAYLVMKGNPVSNIQISMFQCGGFAVGLGISHKFLDGVGLSVFMNAWAAAARGSADDVIPPNFNSVSVFPTDSSWLGDAVIGTMAPRLRTGSFVTRRFTFRPASIAKLRELASDTTNERRATRIEAVSALLWKSFTKASAKRKQGVTSWWTATTHAVNLRPRIKLPPTLPMITDRTLCNMVWLTSAATQADTNLDLTTLSKEIGHAISKIDHKFIDCLRGEEETKVKQFACEELNSFKDVITRPGSESIVFTSWCKLGFYEADFGWGRPVWIGNLMIKASLFINLVVLVETRDGEGVEVWVTMDETDLDAMAADSEFSEFTQTDPDLFDLEK